MNTKQILSIIFGLLVAFAVLLPAARAEEIKEQTKLTFDQAVEIPGQVLPAGTYWFQTLDDISGGNIVQIFSSDREKLVATEITASAERLTPADSTVLKFAESDSSGSPALMAWFYPGETTGHEFLYSSHVEKELAQDKQQTVVAREGTPTQVNLGF